LWLIIEGFAGNDEDRRWRQRGDFCKQKSFDSDFKMLLEFKASLIAAK
jgi:hypothetical protein